MSVSQQRFLWVDYAKGIGIILVAFTHISRGVYKAGIAYDQTLYSVLDSMIYSFHMPLFFFLSGLFFFSSLEKRGSLEFVRQKIDTILYPYIVWSLLQGSIEALMSRYTNGAVTFPQVLSLLWMPRKQFWFLYALFLIFLMAVIVFPRVKSKYHWVILLLSVVVYLARRHLKFTIQTEIVAQYFVYFAMGITFLKYKDFFFRHNPWLLPLNLLLFGIVQYYFHITLHLRYDTDQYAWTLLLATVSIFLVVSFAIFLRSIKITFLKKAGEFSLAILVMHILVGSGLRIVLQRFLGIENAAIHLIGGTLTSVGVPMAVMYFFQEYMQVFFTPPQRIRLSTELKSPIAG